MNTAHSALLIVFALAAVIGTACTASAQTPEAIQQGIQDLIATVDMSSATENIRMGRSRILGTPY